MGKYEQKLALLITTDLIRDGCRRVPIIPLPVLFQNEAGIKFNWFSYLYSVAPLLSLPPPRARNDRKAPSPHLRKLLNQDNDSGILIVLAISQVNPKVLGSLFCLRFKKDPDRGSYTDLVYIKPYCRSAPYLVGIALGYLIYIEKVAPSESPLVSTCRR